MSKSFVYTLSIVFSLSTIICLSQQNSSTTLNKRSFLYSALNDITYNLPQNLKNNRVKFRKMFVNDSVKMPNDFRLENRLNQSLTLDEYLLMYKRYFSVYGPTP